MREVADELAAMLKPTTKVAAADTLEDLGRRIAVMTEWHRRRDEDRDAFNHRVTQAWHHLVEEVAKPALDELARHLPNFSTRHPVQVAMPRALVRLPSIYLGSEAWGAMILAPGDIGVRVDLGISLRTSDDSGRSTIAAVVEVHRHNQGRGSSVSILEQMVETAVGSAHFEATSAEIQNAYVGCLPAMLIEVARALEAERQLAVKVVDLGETVSSS
jgi:hypothetical protein